MKNTNKDFFLGKKLLPLLSFTMEHANPKLFSCIKFIFLSEFQNFCDTFKSFGMYNGNLHIFSSPEPLGSQGELIGWP